MTVHSFGMNEWLNDCVLRKPCLLSDTTAWLVTLWCGERIMSQQGVNDYQSTNGCLVAQWFRKGHFWVVVWFWLWELVWHTALESGLVKEPFLTTVGSSHRPHKIHKLLWPQWSCEYICSLIWEVIYVLWLSAAVDYIRQLDVTLLFFLIGDYWMSCMLLPVTSSSDVWNKMGSTTFINSGKQIHKTHTI
jgi:hypothetical protein